MWDVNCGLCAGLLMDENRYFPVPCSQQDRRKEDRDTLEGLQKWGVWWFLANEGAEQCGFCNPGFIMNVIAMFVRIRRTDKRRTDQGISCRKSVQMLRFCLSDSKHSEIYLNYKKQRRNHKMKYVNQPVQKTDAMALVTGKPVYTWMIWLRRILWSSRC